MNSFDTWLDEGFAGRAPLTVESFARSAIGELPRVTTQIRLPNLDSPVWQVGNEEPKP